MNDNICFDKTSFYSFVTVAIVVISVVLYQIHKKILDQAQQQIQEMESEFKREMKQQQRLQSDHEQHMKAAFLASQTREMASDIQHREDAERMFNPFVPPVKRGPLSFIGAMKTTPVNIPTRGEYGSFQQLGYLQGKDDINHAMPLMGRRIHSNQWEYYTFHHKNPNIKIPLGTHNNEIYDKSEMQIPGYTGNFDVKIYELDHPRYVPY